MLRFVGTGIRDMNWASQTEGSYSRVVRWNTGNVESRKGWRMIPTQMLTPLIFAFTFGAAGFSSVIGSRSQVLQI